MEITAKTNQELTKIYQHCSDQRAWAARDNARQGRPTLGSKLENGAKRTMALVMDEMVARGTSPVTYGPAAPYVARKAGKSMAARFAGKCGTCSGDIAKGEQIRFDGKAHHGSC
jgi:hypothetical protein